MAGCGECPDQCSCVVVNQCGEQYPGAGTADTPMVIPERYDYPWAGESSDGSITITPGDVRNPSDCSDADGHNPDLSVNFCALVNPTDADSGDVLVLNDEDEDCRPHRLRDPLEGEVLTRDPGTGKAGWQGGIASFGRDVPYGVPLEFWGDVSQVPLGYELADFGLVPIAANPNLFAAIGFNASGGVDPGGGMFHKPDKRGVVAAGLDNMGGTPRNRITDPGADVLANVLGVESAGLTAAQMVSHTHPLAITAAGTGVTVSNGASNVSLTAVTTGVSVTGAGTGISIPASGAHNHDGAGANHDFLVENSAPAVYVYVPKMADNTDAAGMRFTSNGLEGGLANKPNREPLTAATLSGHSHTISDPTHTHPISDPGHNHPVTNGLHSHPVSDPTHTHPGTASANAAHVGAAVSRLQPTVFTNYILLMG